MNELGGAGEREDDKKGKGDWLWDWTGSVVCDFLLLLWNQAEG